MLFTDSSAPGLLCEPHGANAHPTSQSVRYVKETIEHTKWRVYGDRDLCDAPATVEYRLLHKAGDWKVYGIVIEGISLVNNHRTQFNTIITKTPMGAREADALETRPGERWPGAKG